MTDEQIAAMLKRLADAPYRCLCCGVEVRTSCYCAACDPPGNANERLFVNERRKIARSA